MIFFRTVFSFQVHKFQKDCCQANMHIVCNIDHNIVFTTGILNHCSATYTVHCLYSIYKVCVLMIVVFIHEFFKILIYSPLRENMTMYVHTARTKKIQKMSIFTVLSYFILEKIQYHKVTKLRIV